MGLKCESFGAFIFKLGFQSGCCVSTKLRADCFYSIILDSQNTFYLLLTFTLHLLLLDMLTPCLFQASVAGLRRTFSVIGCYMGVWCSECDRPNWNGVPVPLYHMQFSTGNFWLLALSKSILGLY